MTFKDWIFRALNCQTVAEFETMLREFAATPWTLEEKSIMSAVYSPRVVKLLRESEDKYRRLEDMAQICWRPTL